MDFIYDLFEIEAEAKLGESVNNEIKVDNFAEQAAKENVLKRKPDKDIIFVPESRWLSYFRPSGKITENELYFTFYWYLKDNGIVKSKVGLLSFMTADSINTIDTEKVSVDVLKKLINPNDVKFPVILKNYVIDYVKLSRLLTNYKYHAMDEVRTMSKEVGEWNKKGGRSKRRIKSRKDITRHRRSRRNR
jgi:hypothetical protein